MTNLERLGANYWWNYTPTTDGKIEYFLYLIQDNIPPPHRCAVVGKQVYSCLHRCILSGTAETVAEARGIVGSYASRHLVGGC